MTDTLEKHRVKILEIEKNHKLLDESLGRAQAHNLVLAEQLKLVQNSIDVAKQKLSHMVMLYEMCPRPQADSSSKCYRCGIYDSNPMNDRFRCRWCRAVAVAKLPE